MNQDEKEKLFMSAIELAPEPVWGGPTHTDAFELIFAAARKDGQESILRAMKELVGRPIAETGNAVTAATVSSQAVDTIKALGDWISLDPTFNRYHVIERAMAAGEHKRWMVTLYFRSRQTEGGYVVVTSGPGYVNIFGSTHSDALAKAAQFCLLELEQAQRK